jgi:ABC-2 type transport system permease protein
LISINIVHSGQGFLIYEPRMGFGIVFSSMLSAGLSAGAGVLVSLRASSVRQAQQTLGLVIMLILFVPIFGIQALPMETQLNIAHFVLEMDSWKVLSILMMILLALNVMLIGVAMVRFQRTRLILE